MLAPPQALLLLVLLIRTRVLSDGTAPAARKLNVLLLGGYAGRCSRSHCSCTCS